MILAKLDIFSHLNDHPWPQPSFVRIEMSAVNIPILIIEIIGEIAYIDSIHPNQISHI